MGKLTKTWHFLAVLNLALAVLPPYSDIEDFDRQFADQ